MTKRELIEALKDYTDEQYVCVCLYSDVYPNGSQVFLQGIKPITPMKQWCYDEELPKIVGLAAHADNTEINDNAMIKHEPYVRFSGDWF